MKTLYTNIEIKKITGKKTLATASDVFSYIDYNFKNWNTDKEEPEGKTMELAVCEMTQNGTFAHIFTKPEDMVLSQEQIIEFCKTHKDKLNQSWYTFFLFKVNEEFFVAYVFVRPGGLVVHVYRFSDGRVWRAERGLRFVIPQLALKHLDNKTLRNSNTLTLRIEKLEEQVEALHKFLIF